MTEKKLIAHRGNINGPNERENAPEYINETLGKGYYTEVDVWGFPDDHKETPGLWLGHDKPQYKTTVEYLLSRKDKLYIHAKNIYALGQLLNYDFNCFFHDSDDATLTSKGEIWTYPGKKLIPGRSILVLPEWYDSLWAYRGQITADFKYVQQFLDSNGAIGVCSDYLPEIII